MTRTECLDKAKTIISGERESQYGKPEDNFKVIANLWSVYKDIYFTAEDVAIMMALLKLARIKTGSFKDDSYIDLAGYAACACEIAEKG